MGGGAETREGDDRPSCDATLSFLLLLLLICLLFLFGLFLAYSRGQTHQPKLPLFTAFNRANQ